MSTKLHDYSKHGHLLINEEVYDASITKEGFLEVGSVDSEGVYSWLTFNLEETNRIRDALNEWKSIEYVKNKINK